VLSSDDEMPFFEQSDYSDDESRIVLSDYVVDDFPLW